MLIISWPPIVAAYAIQSYFFAKLIEVFQFTGQKLVTGTNFWASMFFILALGVAACYFVLGYCSLSLSVVRRSWILRDAGLS
jgi:ATP-binding cassette, subfamily B (MDR/TAP), member 1